VSVVTRAVPVARPGAVNEPWIRYVVTVWPSVVVRRKVNLPSRPTRMFVPLTPIGSVVVVSEPSE
jgi:hypothetical protein